MASDRRTEQLRKIFHKVLNGDQQVKSSQTAQHFLEAIRMQQSPNDCIERIISSKKGLDAFRDAIRVDLSPTFIVSQTLPSLQYLSDPAVKDVADGQLLHQVLKVVADPPTVWNALLQLLARHKVPHPLIAPIAWLAFELLSLPSESDVDVLQDVRRLSEQGVFLEAANHETRELGYKIQKMLQVQSSPKNNAGVDGPGGRHDNDHEDYRKIRIYPTRDEFLSTQQPFYLTAREVLATDMASRAGVHLANQFRLLREDMLAELREDHQVATGAKKGRRISTSLKKLSPIGLDFGDESNGRFKKCALLLHCFDGLQIMKKLDVDGRKKLLKDQPNLLRHQAFGVLCRGKEIFGFAFIERDVDRLASWPPILSLQFTDAHGLRCALLALTSPDSPSIQFVLVDTAVFAYDPVLSGLQEIKDLPLQDLLVDPTSTHSRKEDPVQSNKLRTEIDMLQRHAGRVSTQGWAQLPSPGSKPIRLDESQFSALLQALSSAVSLIQGPPGTGKSFIGAQIAKHFWQCGKRILVISFTNHALNQFLEDLIKAGIKKDSVVRIGAKAKCSPETLPLLLSEQKGSYRRSRAGWGIVNALRLQARFASGTVKRAYGEYRRFAVRWEEISELLEFADNDLDRAFYEALQMPDEDENWSRAGKKGQKMQPDYLYNQWIKGGNFPTFLPKVLNESSKTVWSMPLQERESHLDRWTRELRQGRLDTFEKNVRHFNNIQEKIEVQFGEEDVRVVREKSIIGCTTTGAAKHSRLIRGAKPDVVIVEEAGEILESHIITALAPTVKQVVLIGDHKQLRPKINNYSLSVEKGDGFDLNCSMFERLINQGAKHTTLNKQHRMVPEISLFPRLLTYPELVDDPKTNGRPPIRGLQDRVVFINHGKPEESDQALKERRDPGVKESKKNFFEAEMALRCVKYFGQQGYSPDQIVVLAPYLGQIRALQDQLRDNHMYAELSEMDKADLIRAGLLSNAAAQLDKKPLRISTVDNYQGEESDIVIACLTRSNESGDIGFMSAPERLNVLITRARDCLVLIGNMATFMRSKKGVPTWRPFFELLNENGHLYDGLPVKCEKHPERLALLKEPVDFSKSCPDGGCTEPCNAVLKCGLHKCRSRCHRITDHSKAECYEAVMKTCERQHKTKVTCRRQQDGCAKCIQEDQDTERRIKRDVQLEEESARRQEAYARQLQELDDEIEHERRINKYRLDEDEQKKTIEQRRADLDAAKETNKRAEERKHQKQLQEAQAAAKIKKSQHAQSSSTPGFECPDGACAEWEYLKQFDCAKSQPMDELMAMIGLEGVKQEFLSIKSKVDLALRQGTSLASDRFSCSMLGNPGTGKTTVARLYAQLLTEFGVIPGTHFKETTGAAVANAGVSGCKKMVDEILNQGGGVFFIDEAYQLTSGNNPGGGAVVDYLLAEVENLRGKVVFVLAGYNKQMEGFFAHNPGLPSRFPIQMNFADYDDDELLRILELKVSKKYGGLMGCEDGLRGLYCRIIAKRLGYGRGKDGFGNARAVENALSVVGKRQADRIRRERKAGAKPDDMFLTKEDLIGPEPSEALTKCAAWKKLNDLIGLAEVKNAVKALVDSIQQNYQRELDEKPPIQYSLNKVFLGNPGTGKTTVAKLYGEILASLGLLSKGEVVVKNPADFVGAALGQSEQNTKGILASAVGKVLVIDEAYGLYGGGDNQGSSSDPYKTAVIDTIVAEVQSVPGDDRCVLLLGYKDQMEAMFQNVNPGLSRRFPIASGFTFEDFSPDELAKILDLKLKQQGYKATNQAKKVAMEMLDRARNRPNFGNGGEIDIILDATKARHQRRISQSKGGKGSAGSDVLDAQDFDSDFNRAERSETNIRMLFRDSIGSEEIVTLLESYQSTVRTLKSLDMDPKENIPFNFLFRGPPGTGKTTTAKKMGKVFYDMGFLATAEVVECSATDLIGQYVGQTGPKVQKLLDKALGRVLFVDEAYRLGEGHFAKEAMDELVDSVTKERYFKKLIIILAGYDADINRLMTVNAGLTSRFPETVNFRSLTSDECMTLLLQLLQKNREILKSKRKDLDLSCFEVPSDIFRRRVGRTFARLAGQEGWASARDVQSLARGIFNKLLQARKDLERGLLTLREDDVVDALESMANEREARASSAKPNEPTVDLGQLLQAAPPREQTPVRTATTTAVSQAQAPPEPEQGDRELVEEAKPEVETRRDDVDHSHDHKRDAGVSDAVWEQLQRDRAEEAKREEQYQQLKKAAADAGAAAREKIVKMLLEAKRKPKEKEERKTKLAAAGRCPVGFAWIKQQGGYRCEGGSHWISEKQVAKL